MARPVPPLPSPPPLLSSGCDLVGFDLDGTLLDTSGELAASVDHMLGLAGREPLGRDAIRPMIGLGMARLVDRALAATGESSAALVARWTAAAADHYADNLGSGSPAFEGLAGVLDVLAARGTTLAVVTNKRAALATALLDRTGWLGRFATVIGGDTLGPDRAKPKPDLIEEMIRRVGTEAGRTLFVGDTVHDIDAARAAGVTCVAVAFGFSDRPVATLGADAIIARWPDLIPVIDRLFAP